MLDKAELVGLPDNPTAGDVATWNRQERFLEAFSSLGGIYKSAAVGECSARSVELWVISDAFAFQKRFQVAQDRYLEKCVAEIDRRAFDGIDKPIYYKGERVDTIREYSDNLAMFRVKFLNPEYRDNHAQTEDMSAIRESLDILKGLGVPRVVEGTATVVPDDE